LFLGTTKKLAFEEITKIKARIMRSMMRAFCSG